MFKDADDVGIYGIAWRFLEMLVAFPAFFVMSVFPLLSDAAHQKAVDALGSSSSAHSMSSS